MNAFSHIVANGDAPPCRRPPRPAIENAETLDSLDSDMFDRSRALPVEESLRGEIAQADLDWSVRIGRAAAPTTREGAAFVRLADDAFVIPVTGGQILHEDRHLSELSIGEARGFSEHCWNLVVRGSEDQLLLCEVSDAIFEHYPLDDGAFIYMNTVNRHALSRKDPSSLVVIVQVDGYGPEERDLAMNRIAEVLRARPTPHPL